MCDCGYSDINFPGYEDMHIYIALGFEIPSTFPEKVEVLIRAGCGRLLSSKDGYNANVRKVASWAIRNHIPVYKQCEATPEQLERAKKFEIPNDL